jgi:hypothetical protein
MVQHPRNERGVWHWLLPTVPNSRGYQLRTSRSGDTAGMAAHYLSYPLTPSGKGNEMLVHASASRWDKHSGLDDYL